MKKYSFEEMKCNLEAWAHIMEAIKVEVNELNKRPEYKSVYEWYTDEERDRDIATAQAAQRLFDTMLSVIDPAGY